MYIELRTFGEQVIRKVAIDSSEDALALRDAGKTVKKDVNALKKAILVLSYLIVSRGEFQRDEFLLGLCWQSKRSNSDEKKQKLSLHSLNNSLSRVRKHLELEPFEGYPTPDYFMETRGSGLDRTRRFLAEFIATSSLEPLRAKSWHIDFIFIEQAAQDIESILSASKQDIAEKEVALKEHMSTIAKYYRGVFLEGVEGKTTAKEFSEQCHEWLDDKRYHYANRVLYSTLSILKSPAKASRQIATDLFISLLHSHPLRFFSPGIVADGYSLLNEKEQENLLPRLIHHLKDRKNKDEDKKDEGEDQKGEGEDQKDKDSKDKDPKGKYLELLYALQLQKEYSMPALRLACDACGVPDAEVKVWKTRYEDDDWFENESKRQSAELAKGAVKQGNNNASLGLKGQGFLQAALARATPNLEANLLKSLFTSSALLPSSMATLFSYAWRYWQLKGDFAALPQVRLLAVLRQQVKNYACQGNFYEVKNICVAWEKERARRKQAYEPTMHFYYVYSLERQEELLKAEQMLDLYKPTQGIKGILYEVLRLVLLAKQGRFAEEEGFFPSLDRLYQQVETSREREYIHARAEILSLKGRLAFLQHKYKETIAKEDLWQAVNYWKEAAQDWQACQDIARELGVRNNIACAYDNDKRIGAALREYLAAQERLKHYPSLAQSLIALRIKLNQLILCSQHQEELATMPEWQELSLNLEDIALPHLAQKQQQLIDDIQAYKQDLPGLLSNALYNRGYIQKKRAKYQEAIGWFEQALQVLSTINDSQLFACSYGEIGICQLELLKLELLPRPDPTALHDGDDEENSGILSHVLNPLNGESLNMVYTDTQIYLAQNSKISLQKAIKTLEAQENPYAQNYRNSLKELESLMPQLFLDELADS